MNNRDIRPEFLPEQGAIRYAHVLPREKDVGVAGRLLRDLQAEYGACVYRVMLIDCAGKCGVVGCNRCDLLMYYNDGRVAQNVFAALVLNFERRQHDGKSPN